MQKIYSNYSKWRDLFYEYVKLLTTQRTKNGVVRLSKSEGLKVYSNIETLKRIPSNETNGIKIIRSNHDESLHYEQMKLAIEKSSENVDLKMEYKLLLNAMKARKKEDYRVVVIKASNAVEVCLQSKIIEVCIAQNIKFYENLLRKYAMLGGKFELAKLLGIPLRDDFVKIFNEPRNKVMHKTFFPNITDANQIIDESTKMLKSLQPIIYEE